MNGNSSIMTSSWRHIDIRFFGTLGENVEEVKLSKYTKFHAFITICTIVTITALTITLCSKESIKQAIWALEFSNFD